mmetsp:Transcript_22984/g.42285  ORF Transcript_22984/g.42285 Transcript_22984/m.42285 type:complete len:280 (-) Transcript_22984:67-906(-)
MTIPARLQWIEYEAKRTAEKIRTRREILDFYAATKREPNAEGGVLANGSRVLSNSSQTASVNDLFRSSEDKGAFASLGTSWQTASCPSLPALEASQSRSTLGGTRPRNLPALGAMASRPARSVTLNDRVKMASLMAHKNAVEVSERRDLIDFFKRKRQESNAKEELLGAGKETRPAMQEEEEPDVASCMKKYPLVGAGEAAMLDAPELTAQGLPPLHPTLGTSSIFSRVAACEKRMLHNHQVMSYHRQVIDEARERKKANDEAAAAMLASMRGLNSHIS